MSFLANLGKGFIRSAVNQVGRDTGRVVSNKIYGDAHATPIKGITQTKGVIYDENEGINLTEAEFSAKLRSEGYKSKYFNTHPFSKCFMWIIGFIGTLVLSVPEGNIYAIIPPALLFIYSVLKLISSYYTMEVYKQKQMTVYKTDLRYKDGKRFAGYQQGEVTYDIFPTKIYKSNMIAIFVIYTFLAAIMYFSAQYYISLGDAFSWSMVLPLYASITIIIYAMHLCFKYIN